MQIEERVFARKVPDFQRLTKYGFQKNEKGQYVFATPFMDKQFQAKATVDSKGKVQGTVIDNSMGEEYLLLRSVSPGPFASEVIEVKIDPKDRTRLLKLPGIYHGYHMNKGNWL